MECFPPQLPPRPQDFNRISIPLPIPIPLDTREDDSEELKRPNPENESSLIKINGNTNSAMPVMPAPPSGSLVIDNARYEKLLNLLISIHLHFSLLISFQKCSNKLFCFEQEQWASDHEWQ